MISHSIRRFADILYHLSATLTTKYCERIIRAIKHGYINRTQKYLIKVINHALGTSGKPDLIFS